jgi:ABC-type sugar transport system permease subunit
VWSSGIQIIIFLAALQNIPVSAKEAAVIEGATSWDYFWKITFPYVSPFILANFIFTFIDAFTNPTNAVMKRIFEIRNDLNFGLSAAMSWIYFGVVLAVICVVTLISRKWIYYGNEEA